MREKQLGEKDLLGLFWPRLGKSGVQLVQVGLEALFGGVRQTREFNAHAHAGVARANGGRGTDVLLVDPENPPLHGSNRQGHGGLNITTISADVGGIDPHRRVHAFITEFQRERNLMTLKLSAIVSRRSRQIGAHFRGQFGNPRALLIRHQLNPNLNFL